MHQSFHKDSVNSVLKCVKIKELEIAITTFSILASLSFMGVWHILKFMLIDPPPHYWSNALLRILVVLMSIFGVGVILLIRDLMYRIKAIKNKLPQARIIRE